MALNALEKVAYKKMLLGYTGLDSDLSVDEDKFVEISEATEAEKRILIIAFIIDILRPKRIKIIGNESQIYAEAEAEKTRIDAYLTNQGIDVGNL